MECLNVLYLGVEGQVRLPNTAIINSRRFSSQFVCMCVCLYLVYCCFVDTSFEVLEIHNFDICLNLNC